MSLDDLIQEIRKDEKPNQRLNQRLLSEVKFSWISYWTWIQSTTVRHHQWSFRVLFHLETFNVWIIHKTKWSYGGNVECCRASVVSPNNQSVLHACGRSDGGRHGFRPPSCDNGRSLPWSPRVACSRPLLLLNPHSAPCPWPPVVSGGGRDAWRSAEKQRRRLDSQPYDGFKQCWIIFGWFLIMLITLSYRWISSFTSAVYNSNVKIKYEICVKLPFFTAVLMPPEILIFTQRLSGDTYSYYVHE